MASILPVGPRNGTLVTPTPCRFMSILGLLQDAAKLGENPFGKEHGPKRSFLILKVVSSFGNQAQTGLVMKHHAMAWPDLGVPFVGDPPFGWVLKGHQKESHNFLAYICVIPSCPFSFIPFCPVVVLFISFIGSGEFFWDEPPKRRPRLQVRETDS